MNPLSLANLISSALYISLGIYCYRAGKLEPEHKLNRIFLLLCICFSLWGFSFAFMHAASSENEIEFWYNISAFGWCLYSAFVLHFILLMVGKESVFRRKAVYAAIYGPGIIFLFIELTGYLYAADFVRVGYGLSEVPAVDRPWFWIFVIHQTGCELYGLALLYFWGRGSQVKREKKQAKILIATSSASLVLAFTSDILLPALDIFIVPSLSPVFILIWGYGLWYSVSRYKFMSLNLAFTSDEIAARMQDMFFIIDPHGNIARINYNAAALLGLDEKNIINKPFGSLLKDDESFQRGCSSMIEKNRSRFENINEFTSADGGIIPVDINGSMLYDKFGDPIGIVVIAIDLREKIRLQLEIKERALSEEKYRTLLQTNNVGFFEIDLKGNILSCNDVVVSFTGYTKEEIIGVNFVKIMTAETAENVFSVYIKVFRKEIAFGSIEHGVIRKDGTTGYVDTTVSLIADADGRITGYRTIAIDVTARKIFENALRESEERYRLVMENVNDAVFICSIDGHLKYMNPSMIRITGYSTDEMLNRHYLHYVHPDYRNREHELYTKQVELNIEVTEHEYPFIAKDGSFIWAGQTVRMAKNDDGEIEFFGVIRDISYRKASEEALRRSEEKYRHFIENANEIIYKADWRGNIIYCNPAFQKKFEYTNEEVSRLHYLELIPPEYRDEERDFYRNQLKNKIEQSHRELPVLAKSGKILWVEQDVMSIKDNTGHIVEFDSIVHDITDRKAAEDALRESEKKYRHFIENANEIIYKADWHGNFIYSNPACQKMVEYTNEEISRLNYLDLIPPEYRESEYAFYSSQLRNRTDESHRELPLLTKSGKILWVVQDVKSIKDDTGRIVEFDTIVHDITERKAAEDALRKSEMLYQQLMENVSDCVFICRLDGHFKYINHAITRLTGIPSSEIIGMHFLSIVHPDYRDEQIKFYQKQFAENIETTYCEFPVVKNNGEILWAGQTVRMNRNSSGEMEFYGITHDISSLKKAEESRRDLEEAKTRFFANISHEIRTPLTLMLGPIESVLQGDYGKEIGTDFFRNLHRNTLSLLKLVNNLLDFSKIEAGKLILRVQEGDIVYFARHYLSNIQLAGKAKKINLNFKTSDDSIFIWFDPERMDKVFMNLLSNALKFTGEGDAISIEISADDNSCRVTVRDTGEGIPEHSISSIFDRFSQADTTSTRKYEGTGIGLALVKELVELHGGSISVESRFRDDYPDDHGSAFSFTIPKGIEHFENRTNVKFTEKNSLDEYVRDYRLIGINEIEQAKISAPSSSSCCGGGDEPVYTGAEKTILVVDDNEDMRNFLMMLLRRQYRVYTAVNGVEGVSCARNVRPDIIVTDVMMPVMNGFEMTSVIKNDEELKSTPVIMLTADTELMNKVAGLEYGADDYLHKPFNSMELMTRISSLLKNYEYQQLISRRNADIESELEVARLLQQRLLPSTMPDIPGFWGHAVYIPMDKVGGDFYDIEKRDDSIDIFIADVSGHGLPGAFLATVAKMALENITERPSTDNVLFLLNNIIHRYTVRSNFVTAFYAIIDINTKIMRYSSAGHIPPVIYRKKNDEFIELQAKGKPLGWYSDTRAEEKKIQLESGDRIIFYTDGITECANAENEILDEAGFYNEIRKYAFNTAEEFCGELMNELEKFKGKNTFDDDITMIVLDVL